MKQAAKSSSRTGIGVNQRKTLQTYDTSVANLKDAKDNRTKFIARIGLEQSPKTSRELITNTPNMHKTIKYNAVCDVSSPYYNKNKSIQYGFKTYTNRNPRSSQVYSPAQNKSNNLRSK